MSAIPSSTVEPAQGEQRLRIPGFGLPVNYQSECGNSSTPVPSGSIPFPHALRYWEARAVTVREKNMLAMINDVTDKDEWRRKVFDKSVVDPSLFPLVYGRTRILPHGTISLDNCLQSFTRGEQTQVPPRKEAQS